MESTDNGNPSGCHDSHSEGSVDGDTADASKSKSMVPPYWSHRRYESYASVENTRPPPITLEDHTEGFSEQSDSVWAKRVLIEDYVLVAGSVPNVGKFVVYTCKIETLDGVSIMIRKRYSEFDELRAKLVMTFPNAKGAMPPLPPKSIIYKFRPNFLEKRREGLTYFLNCVLLNPDFSSAPVTKEFIFS